MSIEDYNPLSPPGPTLTEHEFADALVELVEVRDALDTEDFNERALQLMDRLVCGRIDRQEKEENR